MRGGFTLQNIVLKWYDLAKLRGLNRHEWKNSSDISSFEKSSIFVECIFELINEARHESFVILILDIFIRNLSLERCQHNN